MRTSLDFLSPLTASIVMILIAIVLACFVVVPLAAGPAVSLSRRTILIVLRTAFLLLLVLLLSNPVHVVESDGARVPADVFLLLDSSESMALDDDGVSRWSQAIDLMRKAIATDDAPITANLSLFQFGRRLHAIEKLPWSDDYATATNSATDARPRGGEKSQLLPTEPDTQLLVALRQTTSRFRRQPPAGVVVFSDGRTRDADRAAEVAAHFGTLGVPIHVVPVGNPARGGDVSVVSLIAPAVVRKHSRINVQAFVRSYGYESRQAEVELLLVDAAGASFKKLDSVPLVLTDGFQSVNMNFESDESLGTLRARVLPLPDERTGENNACDTRVQVERTKIRLLYVEGSRLGSQPVQLGGRIVMRGPFSGVQDAVQEDPDVECKVVVVSGGRLIATDGSVHAFPRSPGQLASFDALLLSNVAADVFSDEELSWIVDWVEKRGAGICMVGSADSFAGGTWQQTSLAKLLPVLMDRGASWDAYSQLKVRPNLSEPLHPIFRLLDDRRRNREVLEAFPIFRGGHAGLVAKTSLATVLATNGAEDEATESGLPESDFDIEVTARDKSRRSNAAAPAAITAGRYGRGRTLALAFPIVGPGTESFLAWSSEGNHHYNRFWRNTIYWLTENSFVGRRRLTATADKRFYEPGDTVALSATAYDEGAGITTEYRVLAMAEPQSLDVDSDHAPIRWPSGIERTSGEEGPLVLWGEEFEIPVRPSGTGKPTYALELKFADAQAIGQSSGGMRIELTAYERDTQVDSTSLPLQVLHDPFEQQNPFPDHELLKQLASGSGGTVISRPDQLNDVLREVPVTKGPSRVSKTPAWSNWWLLVGLIGLLTAEWCVRRSVGLA
jgi:uncharacterized membrane protein